MTETLRPLGVVQVYRSIILFLPYDEILGLDFRAIEVIIALSARANQDEIVRRCALPEFTRRTFMQSVAEIESSPEVQDLRNRVSGFLNELIYPNKKVLEK